MQLDTSEFIGCRFDGLPIAARLYLTNSAKHKRRKPPRNAPDLALGRLQSNSTSMRPCVDSIIQGFGRPVMKVSNLDTIEFIFNFV